MGCDGGHTLPSGSTQPACVAFAFLTAVVAPSVTGGAAGTASAAGG